MRFFASEIVGSSPIFKVRCDFWFVMAENCSETARQGQIWPARADFFGQLAESTLGRGG
jgi:hypothetical protein